MGYDFSIRPSSPDYTVPYYQVPKSQSNKIEVEKNDKDDCKIIHTQYNTTLNQTNLVSK
jgi:hypothetical protein